MRKVILDTSFILTAVRQKVDFFHYLEMHGMEAIVPEQTLKELKGLGAELALKIMEKHKFKSVRIPGKDADSAIVKLAKENSRALVATLDKGLMKRIKNSKMILRQKKKIEIV